MGDFDHPHHYNPWLKWRAGWLTDDDVKTVTESGDYTIRGIEMDPATAPENTFTALHIRRSPISEFIVYYRSQEPNANTGALISLVAPTNRSHTILIDMTPGSLPPDEDYLDAALLPGNTVTDISSGIELSVLEKFDDSLLVHVKVPSNPVDIIPVIGFISPEAGLTTIGGVDYEVMAYDPDEGSENGAGIESLKMTLGWIQGDNPYVEDGTEFVPVDSIFLSTPPYTWHVETESLPDEVYRLKVLATSTNGSSNFGQFVHIIDNTGPSVANASKESELSPAVLHQNAPNPFSGGTLISYRLNEPGVVVVSVHDKFGRKVKTLLRAFKSPGEHILTWDGRDAGGNLSPNGIYLCELRMEDQVSTIKMIYNRE